RGRAWINLPYIGGLGPSARIRPVASEPQRIWSRIHQRYSRKRRRQAASSDIPQIKEAGCAHCCFSRCNRIARKRDTKNGPRRQRAEMTLSLPIRHTETEPNTTNGPYLRGFRRPSR